MPKEMDFFIFLLENYAAYKGTSADQVLAEWDEFGITELLYEMYERYHVERIENAYDDIDTLIFERQQ